MIIKLLAYKLGIHCCCVFIFAGQLVLDIFRAPIQIILGVLYVVLFGLLLWLLPTKHFVGQMG